MPKNYMEIVIDNLLPIIIKEYPNLCTCDKCINDIKARTLNNLQPLYVVHPNGELFAKASELDRDFQIEVIQKIVESINVVHNNTKHHEERQV